MNLLTNASDALGGRAGVIRLRTGRRTARAEDLVRWHLEDELAPGECVFLEVADTGCGMDEETQARIFEPFFTTKDNGRGLGMATVQGILRGHKGTLTVASRPGEGSVFTMLVPMLLPAPKPAPPVAPPAPHGRPPARSGRGRTVLVVDDEAEVRGVMVRVLEATGFAVVQAADGVEGVAAYREHGARIDAVLLDLSMPRQSGGETFRRIRALDPQAKVIVTSGYGDGQTLAAFGGSAPAAFLRKPFRVEELLDAVFGVLAAG